MERDSRRQRPATPRLDDEAAADVARDELRCKGVIPIQPDPPIAVVLAPGEHLLTVRHVVRVEPLARNDEQPVVGGDLYLTDRRLVLGERGLDLALEDIREVGVVDDELLLLIEQSGGVRIHIDDPRVLRVEISAARSARRVACRSRPVGQSDSR